MVVEDLDNIWLPSDLSLFHIAYCSYLLCCDKRYLDNLYHIDHRIQIKDGDRADINESFHKAIVLCIMLCANMYAKL